MIDHSSTLAHVVTGSFGAGKTTAMRWLMAHKPEQELWVVLLNEFTAAGIDVVTVAEAARGAADVRLVAGGCLCCVGELEFGKQLREILRRVKPVRLLIEPSGAGHAGAIVDELASYEAQGVLQVESVICLVDAVDACRIESARGGVEWAQIQASDALLMSKPDLATPAATRAFAAIVDAQFPAKRFVGTCSRGALPPEALQSLGRVSGFSAVLPAQPVELPEALVFTLHGCAGTETQQRQLGLWSVTWIVPREIGFARSVMEPRLAWLLGAYDSCLRRVKGIFLTGPKSSWLVQSAGGRLSGEDSAYRRDSRLEIVLSSKPTHDFLEDWRTVLRDASRKHATGA